jgi:zinc/manganese transport system substrate-binding protein
MLTTVMAFAAQAKLNIVATLPDLGALAREIGGDAVEVFVIARPTEDAHFVDAKPSFVVKLNRADALIEGGAELEAGWLSPLVEKARNAKIAPGQPGRIVASEGVHLLEVPTELDRSKGDVHGAGNPHYTADPANAKIVAAHLAKALARLEAKSAPAFMANLERFNRDLDAKLTQWQTKLDPFKGRRVVAYHNSWPYFAERFGVRVDLFLEPKPGIPPAASHLAKVSATMKAEGVKAILVEPFRDRRYAETVARHTGAAVLDVWPVPGGKGGGETYIEWMDQFVASLAGVLAGK